MKKKTETPRQTSNRRLKELAKMLNNHNKLFPKVEFDMTTWGLPKDYEKAKGRYGSGKKILVSCTSAACATGSACIHKPFVREGLSFKYTKGLFGDFLCPEFGGETSWNAVKKFFGITEKQAAYLFRDTAYPKGKSITPKMVARRVRSILKRRTA